MTEKGVCPHCGQAVYATDAVCVSCGKSLGQAEPPVPHARGPTSPTVAGRPPTVAPLPSRIVHAFGDLWDVFPWVALIMNALPILVRCNAFDPTDWAPPLQILFAAAIAIWALGLVIWIVVDVLNQRAGWWWIVIAMFLCHPLGLLWYLLTARE